MKTIKLNSYNTIPALGLGTWKAQGDLLYNAILYALQCGYRHIDTASIYGNEAIIGKALATAFQQKILKREDLFITSKLWNDAHHPENVEAALKASLEKLQLNYLDLYLIHWPVAFKNGVSMPSGAEDYINLKDLPNETTWKAMERVNKIGLTKHIGVSNFSEKKLHQLLKNCEITPQVNQVELHPLLQQENLLSFCKHNNIVVTAYSPLGSGDRIPQMKAQQEPNLFEIELLNQLAVKYNTTVGNILIAWHINNDVVVIPKATSNHHIEDNFKAQHLALEKDDLEAIKSLNKNYRFITGKFFEMPEKGYYSIYDE